VPNVLTASFKPPTAATNAISRLAEAGVECDAIGLIAVEPIDEDTFGVDADPGAALHVAPAATTPGDACVLDLLDDSVLVGGFGLVAAGLYRRVFTRRTRGDSLGLDADLGVGPVAYVIERLHRILHRGEIVLCVVPAGPSQTRAAGEAFSRHGGALAHYAR